MKEVEHRNEQFEHIAELKKEFIENHNPILRDNKKKEIIGDFYREGALFCTEAQEVNDYDFNSFSNGVAVSHGIYDVVKKLLLPDNRNR